MDEQDGQDEERTTHDSDWGRSARVCYDVAMATIAQDAGIESTCGHCGYCVRGISGLICPECGSDLRIVGILPPNYRRRVGVNTKTLLWTLLLPIPAFLISLLLLNTILPYSRMYKTRRTIFCQAPYLNRQLEVFGSKLRPQPALMHTPQLIPDVVTLFDMAQRSFMVIDLKTGAYTFYGMNGLSGGKPSGFNGSILANWFGNTGINATDPRVLRLCNQVYAAMQEIQQGNGNKFTPFTDSNGMQIGIAHPAFTFFVRDEPSPYVIVGLSVLWLAVWVYGIQRIRKKNRSGVVASATTGGG